MEAFFRPLTGNLPTLAILLLGFLVLAVVVLYWPKAAPVEPLPPEEAGKHRDFLLYMQATNNNANPSAAEAQVGRAQVNRAIRAGLAWEGRQSSWDDEGLYLTRLGVVTLEAMAQRVPMP